MPKFRNASTGVVVEASEKVAARLGSDWEPFDGEPVADAGHDMVDAKPEPVKRKPGRPRKS